MLSNTATPRYYGAFREKVLRGEIPVNREISQQMTLIDHLIEAPWAYYDDEAVESWIRFCENELTLTDGSDFHMLDTFKLWGDSTSKDNYICRPYFLNDSIVIDGMVRTKVEAK